MPPKGVESKVERYPQQHVRPGRGVPGYLGNVEVYETEPPASYSGDGGIVSMTKALHDNTAGGAEASASKYDGTNVAGLRDELEKRGLPTGGNRGDLVARLEDDDAENA